MVPNTTNIVWWNYGRPISSWIWRRYNDSPDNILDISSGRCYRISTYRMVQGQKINQRNDMDKKKLVKSLLITASAVTSLFVTKEVLEYYVLRGLKIGKPNGYK